MPMPACPESTTRDSVPRRHSVQGPANRLKRMSELSSAGPVIADRFDEIFRRHDQPVGRVVACRRSGGGTGSLSTVGDFAHLAVRLQVSVLANSGTTSPRLKSIVAGR